MDHSKIRSVFSVQENWTQPKRVRSSKMGRRKIGLCACCKTNQIPLEKIYCDNCKEFREKSYLRDVSYISFLNKRAKDAERKNEEFEKILDGVNLETVFLLQQSPRFKDAVSKIKLMIEGQVLAQKSEFNKEFAKLEGAEVRSI